jgi:hypothetical protein
MVKKALQKLHTLEHLFPVICAPISLTTLTLNSQWPTPDNPLPPFAKPSQLSIEARDYAIVTIDVHSSRPAPVQALQTRDEILAETHCNQPARAIVASPVLPNVTDPHLTPPSSCSASNTATSKHPATGSYPSRYTIPSTTSPIPGPL